MSAVNATQLEKGQRFRLPSGRDVIEVHNIVRLIGGNVCILGEDGHVSMELEADATVFLVATQKLTPPDTRGAKCSICGQEVHTYEELRKCLRSHSHS